MSHLDNHISLNISGKHKIDTFHLSRPADKSLICYDGCLSHGVATLEVLIHVKLWRHPRDSDRVLTTHPEDSDLKFLQERS